MSAPRIMEDVITPVKIHQDSTNVAVDLVMFSMLTGRRATVSHVTTMIILIKTLILSENISF